MRYIAPTPIAQIRKWLENYKEDFWFWFVTPPHTDGQELAARDLAYEALTKILAIDTMRDDGSNDISIMKCQLEAAKLLLGNKGPMIAIQNNNGIDADGPLPLGLRRKSQSQIVDRLNDITKHLPDIQALEGEFQKRVD